MTRAHPICCDHCGDSVRVCTDAATHTHQPVLCRQCVVGGATLTDDPSDVLISTPHFWTVDDMRAALDASLRGAGR